MSQTLLLLAAFAVALWWWIVSTGLPQHLEIKEILECQEIKMLPGERKKQQKTLELVGQG